MLNIASSPSFAWTPVTSAAQPSPAAPVGAAAPVRPVQAEQRSLGDARTGNGPARDRPATALVAEPARQRDGAEAATAKVAIYLADPAPLLPRQSPKDQGRSAQEAADEPSGQGEQPTAGPAAGSAIPAPQDMVTSVWLASAAVVDPVLQAQTESRLAQAGESVPDAAVVAATQAARAAMAAQPAANTPLQDQLSLPFAQGDALAAKADVATAAAGDGAPAAYDERGNAARPMPESGTLLSERA